MTRSLRLFLALAAATFALAARAQQAPPQNEQDGAAPATVKVPARKNPG